jgi:hypothetical protein
MTTTRTTEPNEITQGERIEWTKTLSGYPATEYTLQYRIRGVGPGVDITATADGDAHNAVITTAQSVLFAVGTYHWQQWVTEIADADNVIQLSSGTLNVLRGFVESETGNIDLRSPAKIMLDSINAALYAFSTSDVQEYEITTPAGSRRVKRSDKSQLLEMRREWATIVTNEIARERAKNGKPLMQTVKMVVYDE